MWRHVTKASLLQCCTKVGTADSARYGGPAISKQNNCTAQAKQNEAKGFISPIKPRYGWVLCEIRFRNVRYIGIKYEIIMEENMEYVVRFLAWSSSFNWSAYSNLTLDKKSPTYLYWQPLYLGQMYITIMQLSYANFILYFAVCSAQKVVTF